MPVAIADNLVSITSAMTAHSGEKETTKAGTLTATDKVEDVAGDVAAAVVADEAVGSGHAAAEDARRTMTPRRLAIEASPATAPRSRLKTREKLQRAR